MSPPQSPPDPRDLIVTYIGPMRAFAFSLTRNHAAADDLVQNALVKAWKNLSSFSPGTNMQAWLFTILRNTFYSDRRRAIREVEDVDGILAGKMSEKPRHDGVLAMGEFMKAFGTLPLEQREALSLVGASGFSYEEAAATCGVAVGTIKSRVNRGRAKLVELLHLDEGNIVEFADPVTIGFVRATPASGTFG